MDGRKRNINGVSTDCPIFRIGITGLPGFVFLGFYQTYFALLLLACKEKIFSDE